MSKSMTLCLVMRIISIETTTVRRVTRLLTIQLFVSGIPKENLLMVVILYDGICKVHDSHK